MLWHGQHVVEGLLFSLERPRAVAVAEGKCSQVYVTLPNSSFASVWGIYRCNTSAGYRLTPAFSVMLFAYVIALAVSW